jgi:hypothetical protein
MIGPAQAGPRSSSWTWPDGELRRPATVHQARSRAGHHHRLDEFNDDDEVGLGCSPPTSATRTTRGVPRADPHRTDGDARAAQGQIRDRPAQRHAAYSSTRPPTSAAAEYDRPGSTRWCSFRRGQRRRRARRRPRAAAVPSTPSPAEAGHRPGGVFRSPTGKMTGHAAPDRRGQPGGCTTPAIPAASTRCSSPSSATSRPSLASPMAVVAADRFFTPPWRVTSRWASCPRGRRHRHPVGGGAAPPSRLGGDVVAVIPGPADARIDLHARRPRRRYGPTRPGHTAAEAATSAEGPMRDRLRDPVADTGVQEVWRIATGR